MLIVNPSHQFQRRFEQADRGLVFSKGSMAYACSVKRNRFFVSLSELTPDCLRAIVFRDRSPQRVRGIPGPQGLGFINQFFGLHPLYIRCYSWPWWFQDQAIPSGDYRSGMSLYLQNILAGGWRKQG